MTADEARTLLSSLPVTPVQASSLIGWEPITEELDPADDADVQQLVDTIADNARRGRKSKLVVELSGKLSVWAVPITKPISLEIRNYSPERNRTKTTMPKQAPAAEPSAPKKPDKAAIANLCDPDSYLETIRACLPEGKAQKDFPAVHIANAMANMAELLLGNHELMSGPFSDENTLTVNFIMKFAKEKDTLDCNFYPASKIKDSASQNVEDPNQGTLDQYAKEKAAKEPTPEPPIEVLALPAPEPLGLPEPVIIDAEIVETDAAEETPEPPTENL